MGEKEQNEAGKPQSGADKLLTELTNYKGLIIQLTAFMFHSNNLYSEKVDNPTLIHYVVDYGIKIVLFVLFGLSSLRIILTKFQALEELWRPLYTKIFIICLIIIFIIILGWAATFLFRLFF